MADKAFKKNITKETTDPDLNDLEINDNSTIDNLITITRTDCINDNLGNNDKFNVPLEILVNDDKGTQTRNNCEYVITEFFDTFYNDYINFKHYIDDILNILNERNTTSTKKPSVLEQILLLEEQVKILKLENKTLQEERKAQLKVIERLTENQKSDFRKETGNDWTTVHPNKNSKGLSSRQNTIPELQTLYSPLQVQDLPQQILVEENSSIVLPEERNSNLINVTRRRPNTTSNTTSVAKIKSSTRKQYICWNVKRRYKKFVDR